MHTVKVNAEINGGTNASTDLFSVTINNGNLGPPIFASDIPAFFIKVGETMKFDLPKVSDPD